MKTKQLHLTKNGDVEVIFTPSDELEAYDRLAHEALADCRTSIVMAARFLSTALWHLPFERQPLSRTLSVGPNVLNYDPENVVESYRMHECELARDCLHAVLHCVFHHVFDRRHDEFDTWSLACDIAVELCALDLCGARFPCELDDARLKAAQELKEKARNLTAPSLYRVLRHGQPGEQLYGTFGLTGDDVERLRDLFVRDLHDLWAGRPHSFSQQARQGERAQIPDLQARGEGERDEEGEAGSAASRASDSAADADGVAEEEADSMFESPDELSPEEQEQQEAWNKISKHVEAELRLRRQHSPSGNGTMLLNLSVANKKAANYDEFLKRFATIAEDLRVNDDEFDYLFYTYGLNHYGNIPLVEPLEYVESNRVREFVIAIDTSGSCSGRLVREFVQRTYDILRRKTSFGDKINVHIVQCDKEVRTATKVQSLRQLEEYADSFWVSGGGGTDFRPVFSYVDKLVESGEFSDLRGLVYFTDGYGTFPARPPDYDVAFVFVDAEGRDVRVPPWAMKVIMSHDEILEASEPRRGGQGSSR